jgi:signal transduction histidine kinase
MVLVRPHRWLVGLSAFVAVSLSALAMVLHVANRPLEAEGLLLEIVPLNVLDALAWTAGGVLMAWSRPRVVFGWLFLVAALATATTSASMEYGVGGLYRGWPLGAQAVALTDLTVPVHVAMIAVVLVLFPTGRPIAPWAWGVLGTVVGGAILWGVGTALAPGPLLPEAPEGAVAAVTNPWGRTWMPEWVGPLGSAMMTAGELTAGITVLLRWRGADPVQRGQLLWFFWAAAFLPLASVAVVVLPEPGGFLVFKTVIGLVIVAVTVALVRHQLFDVRVVIDRTLVYGAVTLALVGLYVAVSAISGAALAEAGPRWAPSVLATAAAAVAFAPVRARAQVAVRRVLYGHRGESWEAISELARRLEARVRPRDVAEGLAETVTRVLRLPWAEVMVDGLAGPPVSVGKRPPRTETAVRVPLLDRGEVIGTLAVAPRSGENALAAADRRVVADLARHAGVAIRAAAVGEDLRRSRQGLVAAREEERRRLRRDLHDGLGPALTAVTLKLDLARSLLDRADPRVDSLLAELRSEVGSTIVDVRRLVHDLRPTSLDRLGLGDALREQAARFGQSPATEEDLVVVVAAEGLPPLPAAVELAAFRIAVEAMTNVARHAAADRCVVSLELSGDGIGDSLTLLVDDDGLGAAAAWHPGVGVVSMHERAVELGGSCRIGPGPLGGTRVSVRIPVPAGRPDRLVARAPERVPM